MSEQLKSMKETLMAAAQSQMGNLEQVNAKELGEVIDMIKDLEEASYYCAVTKAMEESKEENEEREKINAAIANSTRSIEEPMYYTPRYMDTPRVRYYTGRYLDPRYEDTFSDRMYYNGGNGSSSGMGSMGSQGGSRSYYDGPIYSSQGRDYREGRSPMSRRGYMEAKENHQDKNTQMRELEKYMQELSSDITEMINDASPEEKTLLQQKLNTLMTKIK